MAPILSQKGKQWFVESAGQDRIHGPYSAAEALEVALTEVIWKRRPGEPSRLSVRDNHGIARECQVVSTPEGDMCFQCESLWPKEYSSVTPRCPLWQAFSSFKTEQ
jgi:hypothetical protein